MDKDRVPQGDWVCRQKNPVPGGWKLGVVATLTTGRMLALWVMALAHPSSPGLSCPRAESEL